MKFTTHKKRQILLSTNVSTNYFILIGSRLIGETDLPESLPDDLGKDGFIDGALLLQHGEEVFLDERFWDRLDESLCALIRGFNQVADGQHAEVELPDTRLMIELEPAGDMAAVTMEYKERQLPTEATLESLKLCGQRLVEKLELSGQSTVHTQELKKLCKGDT